MTYFRLSAVIEGRGRLREQAPVLFYTEASFDAKKNRPSHQAVQLCVVNAGGEGHGC